MGSNKILDLTGQRFGRLTAIRQAGRNSCNKIQWECICECGAVVKVTTGHLRNGHTKSCGCYMREQSTISNTKHSGKGKRVYNIWCDIKKRCNNPNSWAFQHYGGRGIRVCEQWQNDFQAFHDWAMANGYEDHLTIDRIDNDGNYEPGNCRWVTQEIQNDNTRRTHYITVNGETLNIKGWAKRLKIKRSSIDSAHKRGVDLQEYIKQRIKTP